MTSQPLPSGNQARSGFRPHRMPTFANRRPELAAHVKFSSRPIRREEWPGTKRKTLGDKDRHKGDLPKKNDHLILSLAFAMVDELDEGQLRRILLQVSKYCFATQSALVAAYIDYERRHPKLKLSRLPAIEAARQPYGKCELQAVSAMVSVLDEETIRRVLTETSRRFRAVQKAVAAVYMDNMHRRTPLRHGPLPSAVDLASQHRRAGPVLSQNRDSKLDRSERSSRAAEAYLLVSQRICHIARENRPGSSLESKRTALSTLRQIAKCLLMADGILGREMRMALTHDPALAATMVTILEGMTQKERLLVAEGKDCNGETFLDKILWVRDEARYLGVTGLDGLDTVLELLERDELMEELDRIWAAQVASGDLQYLDIAASYDLDGSDAGCISPAPNGTVPYRPGDVPAFPIEIMDDPVIKDESETDNSAETNYERESPVVIHYEQERQVVINDKDYTWTVIEDDIEFEVQSVQDSRLNRGVLEYRVNWTGWPRDNRWYPASFLKGSAHLLHQFHELHPDMAGPPKRLDDWLQAFEDGRDNPEEQSDDDLPVDAPDRRAKRRRLSRREGGVDRARRERRSEERVR